MDRNDKIQIGFSALSCVLSAMQIHKLRKRLRTTEKNVEIVHFNTQALYQMEINRRFKRITELYDD